jgi:hypothetical protein
MSLFEKMRLQKSLEIWRLSFAPPVCWVTQRNCVEGTGGKATCVQDLEYVAESHADLCSNGVEYI